MELRGGGTGANSHVSSPVHGQSRITGTVDHVVEPVLGSVITHGVFVTGAGTNVQGVWPQIKVTEAFGVTAQIIGVVNPGANGSINI